jgi:hypothetical protein
VVSASNHGPTRAVLALFDGWRREGSARVELPWWCDVAGDPFAEAQAAASFAEHPAEIAVEAQAVWCAALARADAFSTVSEAGRHALFGALGAIGRLPLWAAGEEPVHCVPVAMDFPDAPGPSRPAGHRVALIGGFNTWFDDETLLDGLLLAMERAPVEVDVTGGPIEGHHTAGFARFREAALASQHPRRFRFHGWLPQDEVAAVVDACHVLVCLDRPGAEPMLGSRTRVLHALHRGLRVIATPRTELVRSLAAEGLVTPVPAAASAGREWAAAALADALVEAVPAPAEGARQHLRERYSVERTTPPLRIWAEHPERSTEAPNGDALGALAAERDRLRAELAALRGSPSFKAMDAVKRRLRRK